MTTFNFLVQGSSAEPYNTNFYYDGASLTATCTCNAGVNGEKCKHRTDILKGETSKIVSNNKSEVANLLSVFKNTPLDLILQQLTNDELAFEKAKKQFEKTKKEVAKIMNGR